MTTMMTGTAGIISQGDVSGGSMGVSTTALAPKARPVQAPPPLELPAPALKGENPRPLAPNPPQVPPRPTLHR